jgi:DNA-binding LacI/PurR family transcriptional regulator
MEQRRPLTPHDIARVAVEAIVDARTVRRFLDGHRIRPSGRARIEDAMQRLGYAGNTSTAASAR